MRGGVPAVTYSWDAIAIAKNISDAEEAEAAFRVALEGADAEDRVQEQRRRRLAGRGLQAQRLLKGRDRYDRGTARSLRLPPCGAA